MQCPSCRTEQPDCKRFCMDCGAPLPMLCPACGGLNPINARFCGNCGTKIVAFEPQAEQRITSRAAEPQHPAPSAERRQLTVMFCDLVGSTALASQLDPEDLRDVIGAYHRCVTEVITRFGGFVARYLGDGE